MVKRCAVIDGITGHDVQSADHCAPIVAQSNAKKVSKRLTNKRRHPAQFAADTIIVERVMITSGEPYLIDPTTYLSVMAAVTSGCESILVSCCNSYCKC